jgi:murein DD-endopeptidase MepM/ murein hydrolase activator NlpD
MKKSVFETKENSFMQYFMMVISVALFSVGVFIMISPQFEQNQPAINVEDEIYWNLRTKLNIELTDDTGIRYYKVTYSDGTKSIELDSKALVGNENKVTINVEPPKFDMFYKGENVFLEIEVIDNSKWNYLNGNKTIKKVKINIDTKKPVANIVENSRYIRRGGSSIAIVRVEDKNIKEAYISFNDRMKFKLHPFYKENYFISLIAWSIEIEEFKKVNLVAIDKAGNKTITKVPLYIRPLRSKKDNIKISSSFIESISSNVLEQSGETIPVQLPKRFIKQNKLIREKNVKFLRDFSLKYMDMSKVDDFSIKPFKRLKGSRTAAGFAERRHYLYNGNKIDEAWHLGMDWASVKKAPVKTSNVGQVIFNEYLGIYGNTIIIDHKMGLLSLYAHLSSSNVQLGEVVDAKQKIAQTGSSGAVMGDHLHFGVLVQGIEVNPLEWMDKNWIKNNITKTIARAKKTIDSN